MKRRRFIAMGTGGAVLVGTGAVGGLWLFCPDPAFVVNSAEAHLDEIARSMTGVAGTGRAWLEANPGSKPRRQILDSMALSAGDPLSRTQLIDALSTRVQNDFADEHIFRHNDWWLAETEARLAALHLTLLGYMASEAGTPRFEDAPEARLVSLKSYNPKSVRQGEPMHHPGLPEGTMWFETAQPPAPRLRVHIDGISLPVNVSHTGFSVHLPDMLRYRLFEMPGSHEIWLHDPVMDRRQRLAELAVVEADRDDADADQEFCDVAAWGPKQTVAGETFNEQPDGASAFWIRSDCFPEATVVLLNGIEVPTTLRPADGLITTHITDHTLYDQPGRYIVSLKNPATGNSREIGTFTVKPRQDSDTGLKLD
ncbi:MAG: hypothetical protein RQ741_04940 [Wenzhouxiangellaceae bacterium]|nr:hypothetical protein [Wenzhouxiangellaceae bacterium]